MINFDPTREEIDQVLVDMYRDNMPDRFDIEEAIYWLAHDWHSGQWSNLYSILSTSPFKPSPLSYNGPEEGTIAEYVLRDLLDHYISIDPNANPECM